MLPADSQARIRAFIRDLGGPKPFALRYDLNERTAQRIYSGKAACPRAILQQIKDQADG